MTKIIEFTPTSKNALLFPPEPIKKNIPDWFKNISATIEGSNFTAKHFNDFDIQTNLTIKKCVPFMDYMTSGYLIKCHTDILIDPREDNEIKNFEWRFPGGPPPIGQHSFAQCPVHTMGSKRSYIKFNNQWVIKTPSGYSCLFMQPLNLENELFKLFPAIVDTDVYDNNINFPGFITTEENFMIPAGHPLMMVFPFKRDEWRAKVNQTIVERSKNKFVSLSEQFFHNVYRNFFHSKKRYD